LSLREILNKPKNSERTTAKKCNIKQRPDLAKRNSDITPAGVPKSWTTTRKQNRICSHSRHQRKRQAQRGCMSLNIQAPAAQGKESGPIETNSKSSCKIHGSMRDPQAAARRQPTANGAKRIQARAGSCDWQRKTRPGGMEAAFSEKPRRERRCGTGVCG
jgi:hypothetical protein